MNMECDGITQQLNGSRVNADDDEMISFFSCSMSERRDEMTSTDVKGEMMLTFAGACIALLGSVSVFR